MVLDAYYRDAIPIALLKAEQDRITAEEALIKTQVTTLKERIAQSQDLVRVALRLVKDCHHSYLDASPEVRRKWNEAFFLRIAMRRREVFRVHYREPFRAILTASSTKDVWRRRTGIEPA